MCPQLAVLLKIKYNILSVGTCRSNRKGWPKAIMNMKKNNSEKGDHKICYDSVNQVCCMQWRDSKVVNLVSTLNDASLSSCNRKDGRNVISVEVPNDFKEYGKKMYGVDKGDQSRIHFGGFCNRAHFQKWYIKIYLAILDCAILNATAAWNMSCSNVTGRKELNRHQFMWALCQQLLTYTDTNFTSITVPNSRLHACDLVSEGNHVPININGKRPRCCVCQLEIGLCEDIDEKGLRKSVAVCSCGGCVISAHTCKQNHGNRKIFALPQFENMTCFQIAHHPRTEGLWKRSKNGYSTCQNHPLLKRLKTLHGHTPTIRRRERRRVGDISGYALFNSSEDNSFEV